MLPALFRKKAQEITNVISINTKASSTSAELSTKIHEDPFFKGNIKCVSIFYYPNNNYSTSASGKIEFKAGKTTGAQSFEGQTIEEILEKMAEFIKTL